MKKLIAILVVFALVATAVFAQDTGITVGGWGRGVFEPFKYVKADGADAVAGAAVSTHWLSGAAVGVSFTGNAEKVGFAVDFRAGQFDPAFGQNYDVGVGDNAYIWVKPLSFLTIVAGHMDAGANNYFRGQVNNFGGFAQAVHATGDEDTIFRGFGVGNGGLILLTPIDGLTIGGLLDAGGNLGRTYEGTPDDDTYKKLQIAAGYQIGTIGLLRAQFIGGTNTIDFTQSGADANFNADGQEGLATYNRIEAAFALTAVDGLTLDIGGKIPLAVTDELATVDYTYQAPFEVAVGVNFGAGDFSIGGRVELGFAESVKVEGVSDKFAKGFSLNALIEPAYNLGSFVVGGDIGVGFAGKDKAHGNENEASGAFSIDLGAWVGLNFNTGLFKAGIAARLPTTNYDVTVAGASATSKNPLIFSVPLVLEYFF